MGADSKIQWTHHTFNPWWGCQRVSPGCGHCYAETLDKRVSGKARAHWGPTTTRRFFGETHWAEPLKWNAAALRAGERHRVFCASMADVFEDRPELVMERMRLFNLIALTPQLDWLLLTKRPENISRLWPEGAQTPGVPRVFNIWLGATVEDRERLSRLDALRSVRAAVHFVSFEPLLEDLGEIDLRGIDWAIVGGESGHGARPFELCWARSLQGQCASAGTAFFMKQLGAAASDPANGLAGAALRVPDDAAALISQRLKDRSGGNPSEWPHDLVVREFPR